MTNTWPQSAGPGSLGPRPGPRALGLGPRAWARAQRPRAARRPRRAGPGLGPWARARPGPLWPYIGHVWTCFLISEKKTVPLKITKWVCSLESPQKISRGARMRPSRRASIEYFMFLWQCCYSKYPNKQKAQ